MFRALILFTLLFTFAYSQQQLPVFPDRLAQYLVTRPLFQVTSKTWDFIIIGAGSAGSLLANRLSANGCHDVLVLEAGASDTDLNIFMPAGFANSFNNTFNWNLESVPQPNVANRKIYQPRGKVLGGTGSVNAMIINKGTIQDFEAWGALGAKNWTWEEVLPYYKRVEKNFRAGIDAQYHGFSGDFNVEDQSYTHDVSHKLIAAMNNSGIPIDEEHGKGVYAGVTLNQVNIHQGVRHSPAEAFLTSAVIARQNLYIKTNALVHKIVFDSNKKATSVIFRDTNNGNLVTVHVRKEVILAAGVFGSPQILLNSGVGPAADLNALGIPIVHTSNGVGKNLHDHTLIGMTYTVDLTKTDSLDKEAEQPNLAVHLATWLGTHTGTYICL
jgi:choline dehydrogenase